MLDIHMVYSPISLSQCYNVLWECVDAINSAVIISFPLDDSDKLADMEREFRINSTGKVMRWVNRSVVLRLIIPLTLTDCGTNHQVWKGQVAALDGCILGQKNPGKAIHNPERYFVYRKGHFGLLLMAMADYHRRFVWIDLSVTPTSHDSLAWDCTELAQRIMKGGMPAPFFISGDNAFNLHPHMMIPGGGDDYDYEQSKNRMPIECAFGMLIRRWGVLWRPLEVAFNRRAPLIGCCCRLHNFCIDRRLQGFDASTEGDMEFTQQDSSGGVTTMMVTPRDIDGRPMRFDSDGRPVELLDHTRRIYHSARSAHETSKAGHDRRQQLVDAISDAGNRRPYKRARNHARDN